MSVMRRALMVEHAMEDQITNVKCKWRGAEARRQTSHVRLLTLQSYGLLALATCMHTTHGACSLNEHQSLIRHHS